MLIRFSSALSLAASFFLLSSQANAACLNTPSALSNKIVYTDGNAIYAVDPESGERSCVFDERSPISSVATSPGQVYFGSGRELGLLKDGSHQVVESDLGFEIEDITVGNEDSVFATEGTAVYSAHPLIAVPLRTPGRVRSLAADRAGVLFFDFFNRVRGVDPLTGARESISGGQGYAKIRDMAVQETGDVVYTDGRKVYQVDRRNGKRELLARIVDGGAVAADPSGDVYYSASASILRVRPDGVHELVSSGEGYAAVVDMAFSPGVMAFTAPLANQLSAPGSVPVALQVPSDIALDSISLTSSGLLSQVIQVEGGLEAQVEFQSEGEQWVRATVNGTAQSGPGDARVTLHTIALENADECELTNLVQCLLPYPSSRFLEFVGNETDTGYRLALPPAGLPVLNGPPLDPAPMNRFDGFSPTPQILMHIPGGVDLAASKATVLLEPDCCGQSESTPYVGVRTHDAGSLDPDSPSVLLDATTGERVLHFVELDARATSPERQVLFLRPAIGLVPGHRYIVAIRGMRDGQDAVLAPELPFKTLRDGNATTIAPLEARRANSEWIFDTLEGVGVERADLQLAFDFLVRSDHQLTFEMLTMRDRTLALLDSEPLQLEVDEAFAEANHHPDCLTTGEPVWRRVQGTFRSPFFLTGNANAFQGVQFLNVDATGTPVERGRLRVPFDISVPCTALDDPDGVHPLLLGHGLFGRGSDMIGGIQGLSSLGESYGAPEFNYIAGATDWRGLSGLDLLFVAGQVVGGIGGTDSKLNNFPSFTARLKQGMANTLGLAHLMKTGRFNESSYFQRVPGDPSTGVFPADEREMYYYGISLGGVMGLFFSALTPDIERLAIDVGSTNFTFLLQRSTQFTTFEALIQRTGLDDPLDYALGLGLLHEQWVSSDPAGYARHITGTVDEPLPGSPAKKILMTVAWLDKQVSNQGSEITARTIDIPNFEGSLVSELTDIPDAPDGGVGVESGYVVYDTGSFDVFDPAFEPHVPPLANQIPSTVCDPHGARPTIPASLLQLRGFLSPGGMIRNHCDGVCDASVEIERPLGLDEEDLCDPLN